MQLSDFHFDLPEALIARYPMSRRSESRLLCLNASTHHLDHKKFYEVIQLVEPGDLLVFNNTRVIPARLVGHKETGGQVELLAERVLDDKRLLGQLRVSKSPQIGGKITFANDVELEVTGREGKFFELKYNGERSILDVIEEIGQIPLPPYMRRSPEESDKERYQTIYAKHKGSVAAPTAGLHFDEELMQALKDKGVEAGYLTLHIGAGTFAPVRVENIKEHKMHAEYLTIDEKLCEQIRATKARGNRVIAVGTTSMRALETASQTGETKPFAGDTAIFIYPGYELKCADVLITNMHLPGSTLMMLVSAFSGYERVMHAYHQAVENKYRFYSYGDAMWMPRAELLHTQSD